MANTDRLQGANFALAIKAPVACASTANLTLSGHQTIDGVTTVANSRVLVKNQTTASENGIYIAASGTWSRAKDFNSSNDLTLGTLVFVAAGTLNANTFWRVTTSGTVVIGTDSVNFASTSVLPTVGGTLVDSQIVRLDGTGGDLQNSPVVVDDSGNITGVLDLTMTDTDTAATEGPVLTLDRDSSSPADNDVLGTLKLQGRNDAAETVIYAQIDGLAQDVTDATEDGGIAFKVMFDGTLTEAFRVATVGSGTPAVLIGKTAVNSGVEGVMYTAGTLITTSNGGAPLRVNRLNSDGQLVLFQKDGNVEGDITVTSGTVTLTGAHLSRWSQMTGQTPARGTVVETLDEMCVWEGEDNEHLTKCKVSDAKGSPAVCGVFSHADEDDDLGDVVLAQSGDFVIRVTGPCKKGDLLESNGDGTARVQTDDICRASTVAKVMFGFPEAEPEQVNIVPCLLMCG